MVIVVIAVSIRIIFWLLEPVLPFLLVVLVTWALWQARAWWINRW